tara:strand:+ start:705 stop:1043 length:339 start_codon:yes stop_codon:yes gene_type:complete
MSWRDIVKNETKTFDEKRFENVKEDMKNLLTYMNQTEYMVATSPFPSQGLDDTSTNRISNEIRKIVNGLENINDILMEGHRGGNARKPKNYGEVSDQEAYEQDRADVAGSRQ